MPSRHWDAFAFRQPSSISIAGIPDDHLHLTLRQVDQLRTDIANLECGQEFLMQRVNALPSARDLWRAITLIALVAAVLGIVGIEAFWRYFPCSLS